jgi:hypothetical protein
VASGAVALSREDARWPAGVLGCCLAGLLACCLEGLITGPHRAGAIYRAVPGSCRVPGKRPRHGLVPQAVLARARWLPGRVLLGTGQNRGPWAGPLGHGLHGHIYM